MLKDGTNELVNFTTAVLPFYLVTNWDDQDIIIKWIDKAIELFQTDEYSISLKIGMTGDNLVTFEVRRMGGETAPLIIGSIVAMVVFVVIFSFR